MAEIKFDFRGVLSRLNINRTLYILAFLLIVVLLSLYSMVLNTHGREELQDMYALKEKHDHFENVHAGFIDKVQSSLIYSQLYFSEGKELFRFQAIEALNDANEAFNELFVIIRSEETGYLPNLVQLKEKLVDYENGLLVKLASKSALPELELASIISEDDTLFQDFDAYQSMEMTDKVSFAGEETKIKSMESDVFELNVMISSANQQKARELSGEGILSGKLFGFYILLFFLVFIFLYYLVDKDSRKRISKSSQYLQLISTGELPDKLREEKDDFTEIVRNSNYISEYMHSASEFALNIGDGNFNYEFSPKSQNDTLGNALIQMRNKLQEVAEEDRIRNWNNEGQAKFGEILRESGSDLEAMGDKIISNLVDYAGASMGAMYIKNESQGDTRLELLSAFAQNRKKHKERVLNLGEGLAGQVFVEKKRIFLKEINGDHFNIATGLGESKPASVLIVPLKDENNDVEGVIELASFNVIEEYQIQFVEKLGESIASAIKSGKNNSVTKHLLEEMQTREEQMKTQEEELKQNMEELSATQEQMERLRKEDEARKDELESKRRTLYNIIDGMESYIYLKDQEGKYQYVNGKYAEFLRLPVEKIIGNNDFEILGEETASQRENWEKAVIKTAVSLTETEELKGSKYNLHLTAIEIPHLHSKGVLGVFQ